MEGEEEERGKEGWGDLRLLNLAGAGLRLGEGGRSILSGGVAGPGRRGGCCVLGLW